MKVKINIRVIIIMLFIFQQVKKEHLMPAWIKFVNRKDWKPTENSVICEYNFDQKFINKGNRWTFKRKINPVPTIFTEEMKDVSISVRPLTFQPPPKPPVKCNYQEDQIKTFLFQDLIKDFSEIEEKHAMGIQFPFERSSSKVEMRH